ncbi:sugar ABC transporter substrate-binding protein [Metabacillus sp. FJAT-53654]|uniref:Sugar ABC transporter substrate-binding protein n=1 Tax=Metabacillus rhizosphaerae TaxID=3117747 RepID=A0ABZ2MPG8_9BACI
MKSFSKFISFMIILVLLLGIAAGCSSEKTAEGEDGDKITLRVAWWGSQDRHDKTKKVIKLFEEKNPNIKITPEFTGWDGYWEKLATAAAGKNLADVIQMDYRYLMEYVDRGLIEDLNSFVDSGALNLDDVGEAYIEGGYVDDKLYAVNLGTNALAMAYDPAMFKKAGVEPFEPGYTWEEYAEAAKKLKDQFGDGVYGVEGAKNSLVNFQYYLRQHDIELYNEDGTALGYKDDKLLVEFLNYWDELLKDDVAAPPDVTAAVQGRLEEELIVHEKAPTLWFNSNQIVALQGAAGRELKLALLPSLPEGKEGLYLKPSQFFSVSKESKHKEAAAKFIDFITNDLEANEILAAERGVPIATKVRDHLKPNVDDAAREMFDYVELAEQHSSPIYPPEPSGAGELDALFTRLAEQLNFGEFTTDEMAKTFRAEANKILAKNK